MSAFCSNFAGESKNGIMKRHYFLLVAFAVVAFLAGCKSGAEP